MRKAREERTVDPKKIAAIIQKNFIVITRDKTRLFPLILFPIFMIVIFGYTSGNIPKHIPTAIVDYSNSPMSQELIHEIAANEVFNIRYMTSTEGEARRLLDSMKVRAVIEIPPNLDKDINNGKQTDVIIIVDESDSAISATVRQAMSSIVSSFAAKTSVRKIIEYQETALAQTIILSRYATSQQNSYPDISRQLGPVNALLAKAEKNLESSAGALENSLAEPTVFIPSDGPYNLSGNRTFVLKPLGYDATVAQIALFRKTEGLVASAGRAVKSAKSISSQAGKILANRQDYRSVEQNVKGPVATIEDFASTDPGSILMPVRYQEKPAYGTGKRPIDFLIASIIALTIFQGAIMGMGRAVAGEKREGSLTRVFLTPTSNITIVLGTLLFYILFEIFRSAFLILVSIIIFKIAVEGSLLLIVLIIVIYAGVSTAIGMIISSLVRTEQQYFAMSMLVSMPTIFLAGVFFPLQAMPRVMQILAAFLPVTYAGQALNGVMTKGFGFGLVMYPIIILTIFLAVIIGMLFAVFKRDIE